MKKSFKTNLGQKYLGLKKLMSKKISVENMLPQQIRSQKIFWSQKKFCVKKSSEEMGGGAKLWGLVILN